jgi:hypothetical protein
MEGDMGVHTTRAVEELVDTSGIRREVFVERDYLEHEVSWTGARCQPRSCRLVDDADIDTVLPEPEGEHPPGGSAPTIRTGFCNALSSPLRPDRTPARKTGRPLMRDDRQSFVRFRDSTGKWLVMARSEVGALHALVGAQAFGGRARDASAGTMPVVSREFWARICRLAGAFGQRSVRTRDVRHCDRENAVAFGAVAPGGDRVSR